MELKLPIQVARSYKSGSQKTRVMTESWVNNSICCPNCGTSLTSFETNKPVADFYCRRCSEEYELKSTSGTIGKKVVDGAYSTMIERLSANNNPHFFFLKYDKTTFEVRDFLTIPKYFFVASLIEKRKPLNPTARRAGWIGCNIILHNIPEFGKIFYVQDGVAKSKSEVLGRWNRTGLVGSTQDVEAKGWLLDILVCVERIGRAEFSLEDMYAFEAHLKAKHPHNNNVQAKIRQQLQFLRDRGIVAFAGRGKYRMKPSAP